MMTYSDEPTGVFRNRPPPPPNPDVARALSKAQEMLRKVDNDYARLLEIVNGVAAIILCDDDSAFGNRLKEIRVSPALHGPFDEERGGPQRCAAGARSGR